MSSVSFSAINSFRWRNKILYPSRDGVGISNVTTTFDVQNAITPFIIHVQAHHVVVRL